MNDKKDFGFEELMQQFDPTKMAKQFQEMMANSPFSQFDLGAMMDSQKKAAEYIEQANQSVASGSQALLVRQAEMMQQAMTDAASAMEKLANSEPSEAANEQANLIEQAMKKSMENFEEIAGMINGIYSDISEQVENRMEQSVQDLNDAINKNQK